MATAKKPAAKKAAKKSTTTGKYSGKTKEEKAAEKKAAQQAALKKAQETKAKKAAEKKAAEAEAKKQVEKIAAAATKALTPVAKEINYRFELAQKLDDQASDHRLSMALRIAEAKKTCDEAKVSFKEWAEANLKFGYENARKLERIGREGEEKARILIEDMRVRGTEAQRKYEEKKREALRQMRGGGEVTEEHRRAASDGSAPKPPATPTQKVNEVLRGLSEKERFGTLDNEARKINAIVVKKEDAEELFQFRKAASEDPLKRAMAMFDGLTAPDKMKLVEYAAKVTGCGLTKPDFGSAPADDGTMPDIPNFLDRRPKGHDPKMQAEVQAEIEDEAKEAARPRRRRAA